MSLAPGGPPVPGTRPAVAMLGRSPFAAGKTRLTAGLDAARATALRAALLLDTLEAALVPGWPVRVYMDPVTDQERVGALVQEDPALAPHAARVAWHPQAPGDLGQRMTDAVRRTLAAGHDVVVLVGSDIPDLPALALTEARDGLAGTPAGATVALGPADDGGFYLVAATDVAPLEAAFADMMWSRASVLDTVTRRLTAAGVGVVRVRPWHDLDRPDALAALAGGAGEDARRTRWLARKLDATGDAATSQGPPYNER